MTRPAHTAIVGAGIVGLMTAWRLAQRGLGPIQVLDAAPSLLLGASGRNGGGIRAQWTTEENIELARRSIRVFDHLAADTGHATWYRRGGYLMLARTQKQLEALENARRFQNQHGVPTRIITPQEARRIVPGLNTQGVEGASFNPEDGTLFPWPVVHGVAEACRRLGVQIHLDTRVGRIETTRPLRLHTSRGTYEADHLVLAAGAHTRTLAQGLGVDLPTRPQRHEILVTEALKPFLDPMLVDLATGLYASQAMRGELVGGLGRPHPETHSYSSTLEFAGHFSRGLLNLLPNLGNVNILRQWAGSYDVTPDARPILGPIGLGDHILVACGFSGHGFMLSPSIAQLLAELLAGEPTTLPLEHYTLERFTNGRPLQQESLVIG